MLSLVAFTRLAARGQQLPLAAGGFEASGRRLVQLAGARWACARFWIDYRKKLTIECHTLLNNG
jgi:hypothetical protein